MSLLRGKELKEYKKDLHLSKEQKALVIGSILGDGSLRILKRAQEAKLIIEQGTEQKDYVFWKYKKMKEWVLTTPEKVSRVYHRDPSRKTTSWRFRTVSHPEITEFFEIFYPEGSKILPDSIEKLLTHPLSLAVWIMDDGTLSGESFFFSTQNFSEKEQKRLLKCLEENFGVRGTINIHSHSDEKTRHRIRINADSLERLHGIAESYMLSQFEYKFPISP